METIILNSNNKAQIIKKLSSLVKDKKYWFCTFPMEMESLDNPVMEEFSSKKILGRVIYLSVAKDRANLGLEIIHTNAQNKLTWISPPVQTIKFGAEIVLHDEGDFFFYWDDKLDKPGGKTRVYMSVTNERCQAYGVSFP